MISDIIFSIILIVLSLVWAGIGIFQLGLWIPGVSADSGFIPTVFALLTLICSVIMLVQAVKKYRNRDTAEKKETVQETAGRKEQILAFVKKYAPVIFGIFGILCLQILGLIPAVLLLILGWMKLMNQFSWPKSLLIAVTVTVVIYGIFDLWLQIPFPGLI